MNWLADITVGTHADYRHHEVRIRQLPAHAAHRARLPRPLTAAVDAFWSVVSRATEKQSERRVTAALSALDDRMLRDIGLHRGDIAAVAVGSYVKQYGALQPAAPARQSRSRTVENKVDRGPGQEIPWPKAA